MVVEYMELGTTTAKLFLLHLVSSWRSKKDLLDLHQGSSQKALETSSQLQGDLSCSSLSRKMCVFCVVVLELCAQIFNFWVFFRVHCLHCRVYLRTVFQLVQSHGVPLDLHRYQGSALAECCCGCFCLFPVLCFWLYFGHIWKPFLAFRRIKSIT